MSEGKRLLLLVLGFAALSAALVAVKWPWLADPPFWDETCYVPQARFIAAHGLDLGAYRALELVRPPLLTGLLAVVIRVAGPHTSITVLRLVTCLLGTLLLPATFALVRRLGGSLRASLVAVVIVLVSPLFLAQIGLVLSDAPTAALIVLAWVLLLGGRVWGFALVAVLAVFTKESAYFLCGPAALLCYLRGGRKILAAWPALVPGLALLLWLAIHRLLVGVAIPSINAGTIGPRHLPDALLHAFVEGGRFLLVPLAALAVWRPAPEWDALGVKTTAAAIVLLPVFFPAPLPRYMLPTLPMLAALAALAVDRLPAARLRLAALAALAVLLVHDMDRDSFHTTGGHHMDANLGYRTLLLDQRRAAEAVAAAHPRRVLAAFPMYFALTLGPEDHFLPAPVPVTIPGDQPLAELCAHDLLVESTQGNSVEPAAARLRAAHALVPFLTVGPPGKQIVVSRVACPGT